MISAYLGWRPYDWRAPGQPGVQGIFVASAELLRRAHGLNALGGFSVLAIPWPCALLG